MYFWSISKKWSVDPITYSFHFVISSEVFIICRWICHQFGTTDKPIFCWLKGRSDHKVCTKSPTSITFLVCCRHGPFLSCWEIESGWFTKPNSPPLPPRIFFWKVRSWRSLPEEGPPLLLTPTQGSYPEMIDFKDICLSHRNDFLRKLAIKQWCTDFYMSKD